MKLRSSEPFWLIKNGLPHSYPSITEEISVDIVIVGSGITGSLIAHQCMLEGYRTAVIDRREVANGSTSATTSMLQYEIDVPLYLLIEQIGEEAAVSAYRACFDSIDQLEKITAKIRSDCGFRKKDSLYFAAYKKHVAWLRKEFETRKEFGFPVEWLDAQAIERQFQVKNTYGGILSAQGASIDAFRLAHDLLAYNHKKGLHVFDKTEIKKVDHGSKGIVVHTAYGHLVRASKIIYCNGFESVELIKEKFVDLLSTYAIVGEVNEGQNDLLKDVLIWNTADPYIYMRRTDDGRLLIGGEDEDFVDTGKRDRLLGKKTGKLEKQFSKILPGCDFRTDFAWAGTFGQTKDGLPYIGEHPDFEGGYFVLGFGGNGITFSVIGMEMVAAMLQGRSHPLSEYFRFGR